MLVSTAVPALRILRSAGLLALLLALCSTAAAQDGARDGSPGNANTAGRNAVKNENLAVPVIPPLLIIAPTEVRTSPTLADGCWVRLFPQPDYRGVDDLTIAGPIALPSLHRPTGDVYWKQKTESLMVGPKAIVTVYENPSYRNKSATLVPGTREPRLREGLKFTQSIDSLKVNCG